MKGRKSGLAIAGTRVEELRVEKTKKPKRDPDDAVQKKIKSQFMPLDNFALGVSLGGFGSPPRLSNGDRRGGGHRNGGHHNAYHRSGDHHSAYHHTY